MRKHFVTVAVLSAGAALGATAMAADVGANTTVGGQIFADFGDITNQQNGVDVPPSGLGFDVKRAYLIVNHDFDPTWSADLTTDAQYISTATNTGLSNSTTASSGGVTEVFIKRLFLQYKLNNAFIVHAGAFTSPWAPYVETLYGYRFVEKTTTDRLGYANTADWGLNASTATTGAGIFTYSFSVVNGGGYKNPTRTKSPDVEGQVAVKPVSWLNIGAGFYSGHLGQLTESNYNYPHNTADRWDLVAGVVTQQLRVGAEYFNAKNFRAASATTGVLGGSGGNIVSAPSAAGAAPTTAPREDEADGVSAWASYAFTSQWSVFGRYDNTKPSKDINPDLRDTYWHLGADFKPIKGVDLALVYKQEHVTDGAVTIGSGDGNTSYTVGGTGAAVTGLHTDGTFKEIGVYTQVVF